MAVRHAPQLCSEIRDRVDKWEKYWTINRSLYYEWVDFVMGDQWREDESKLFERYNKIPLMFNKLGVLYNHMIGDQIQNTPNLQISPDEDVPVETAQNRAHLIREISLNSDAKTQYQTAYGQAIVGGFGAVIVGTKYLYKKSFDQTITIKATEDPNRCYWDIAAKHICKTDGQYSGYKTRMSRKAFRDKYGKELESKIQATSVTEDSTMAFADDDSITIVMDFEKEGRRETIRKLSDGSSVDEEEFKALEKIKIEGKKSKVIIKNEQVLTVVSQKEEVMYTIKQRQIAGDFVLEEEDFPCEEGEILPILFLDQRSYYTKQGQQITRSFFKDVKDAQKYLNYLATQSAYLLKISRYDQFIMPRKCAASPDAQQQWRDPSVVNGALYYDETPSGAKPEQLRPPELSQSLFQQYERTLMDIQSGTGLYNTQLGDMGNEVSGEAIQGRRNAGSKNTQIPRNSLDILVATVGELINDMIPKVFDTQRSVILPTSTSQEQKIEINKPADPYGMQVDNDMTKGRYRIRLKPGPSYEGQKEEALQSMNMVLQADRGGQVFPLIADLYVENLPLDNNMELRNRLRTLVPQEIIEAGKTGKPLPPKEPQVDPMIQLKQQELQMKEQHAQQEFQFRMKDLDHKQAELQRKAIETQQDMTVAFAKIESEKQEAAAQLQESLNRMQSENNRIGADLHINHSQNILKLLTHASQVHHEKDMQGFQHKHERSIKPTIRE